MSEPLAVRAFSHVCIGVTDIERSLDFYTRLLGMDVVFDVELEGPSLEAVTGTSGARGRMVGGLVGGTMLELLGLGAAPAKERSQVGYTNISLVVADLDAAYEQVGALGFVAAQAPVEIAGVRMFFVQDPDGTPIELIEYPNGATSSVSLWR